MTWEIMTVVLAVIAAGAGLAAWWLWLNRTVTDLDEE